MYVQARGRLLLHHALQRELPAAAASPRASTTRIVRGIYRFARGARRSAADGAPGPARRLGLDPPAGHRRAGAPGREVRGRGRGLQRAVVPAAAPRCARGRTLEPAPSRCEAPRVPYVSTGPAARRRADRGRDRLDEGACPTWSRAGCRRTICARHGRVRPERHARGPAGVLRDRPAADRGRDDGRAGALRRAARVEGAKAIKELGIDPEKADPLAV